MKARKLSLTSAAEEVEGADAIGTGDEVEVVFSALKVRKTLQRQNQWTSSLRVAAEAAAEGPPQRLTTYQSAATIE